MEITVTDEEISELEKLLLPEAASFPDDAKDVIRCWRSTEVVACPGSGKTTVLLAKLKILADRLPLHKGVGICVLSHTNVAVNEIKKRLSGYESILFGYPNFIGTIQGFVDKFITMPYLRNIVGRSVHVVDDKTHARHMLRRMNADPRYQKLKNFIDMKYRFIIKNRKNISKCDFLAELDSEDGAICSNGKPLAKVDSDSAKLYCELLLVLRDVDGIIRYADAYRYAFDAIRNLDEFYLGLFSKRFRYIFVDEYQDCSKYQRDLIDRLFSSINCTVFKIGDCDQSIYNKEPRKDEQLEEWIPEKGSLSIVSSSRYGQAIADVLSNLRTDDTCITSLSSENTIRPVLLVFEDGKEKMVVKKFVELLIDNNIVFEGGVYKAIGAIKKPDTAGLKVGSYWDEFDGTVNRYYKNSYWSLIDDMVEELSRGRLYKVEQIVRKILSMIFSCMNLAVNGNGRVLSIRKMKTFFDLDFEERYKECIFDLSGLSSFTRDEVGKFLFARIGCLFDKINVTIDSDVRKRLIDFFDKNCSGIKVKNLERNIYVDEDTGIKVQFDTIHGVKGETHDATLYLETDMNRASDLKRILPRFDGGKIPEPFIHEYSRRLVYVGMSRPRKLLCVAMRRKTFDSAKDIFKSCWNIIHL